MANGETGITMLSFQRVIAYTRAPRGSEVNSKICDLLGIEFPLFAFSHCRDVIAEVSNAGGFGVLGAAGHTPESLDIELDELRKELDKQRGVTDGKLTEDAEKALVLGFKEFEIELEKLVVGVFDRRKLILENSETPEAVAEMGEIQSRLQAMISKLVGLERERFMTEGGYSRDREIELLERRIAKLHEQIASMEKALKTITNSKVYSNTQIQNVLRQCGLYEEDKNYEKKKEMVKVLLTQNLDLIKQFNKIEPKDSETVENSTSV